MSKRTCTDKSKNTVIVSRAESESKLGLRLISRSDVAAMLGGVSLRTIRRRERPHGPLTPYPVSSRKVCYPEDEVLKLIANARGSAPAEAA
jgi:hypothetical protein